MYVNKRQTRQPDTIGKLLGGLSQAPMTNTAQSFPVTVENMSYQKNWKIPVPTVKNYTGLDNGIDAP